MANKSVDDQFDCDQFLFFILATIHCCGRENFNHFEYACENFLSDFFDWQTIYKTTLIIWIHSQFSTRKLAHYIVEALIFLGNNKKKHIPIQAEAI